MRKIRVLIAKPGLDGHDRGALVISQALRDAGMEVIYTGLRQTPKQIVYAAIQEDVDVIGLSSLSGAHNIVFPKILNLLREQQADDILVIGGGVIPKEDIDKLEAQGVAKIFTPGTQMKTVVSFIENAINKMKHKDFKHNMKKPKGIDHIGIAVKSIEKTLPFYLDTFDLRVDKIVEVSSQKVKVAFIEIGDTKLEFLEPLTKDSPIATFIDKRGEGLHHIAFSVLNIDDRLEQLKKEGIQAIDEAPHIGAAGYPIAFLHPSNANNVLIELCEKELHKGEK
ncbi:methylmalonyl-CoA epimerase [Evansella cellulosilytica]|uniref:Methylmalonyl-CoA epimerase n=1 Tax=Evansella cellulosilytica (strain ATCC 21833 / DSM 2522 / FERM P-1141 / JCM 9156 / N-4) TaxID=649639 RepID=E6TXT2_EVAC2|nr:methylmalonyl-CoA epimerase [Evansella cellulosilytica]ADU30008.1 methylmalonyl-CoA epimerase [Evansella cellulosilytica DSM 2522]